MKYVDDTAVVGLIQDGEEKYYTEEMELFVDWGNNNKHVGIVPHIADTPTRSLHTDSTVKCTELHFGMSE